MTDIQKLQEAGRLVDIVARRLNVRKKKCGECSHVIFADFPEATAHKTLAGASSRIERVIGVLREGTS